MKPISRTLLRKQINNHRKRLPAALQAQLATQALKHIRSTPEFLRAHKLALYIPANGEIDPLPVLQQSLHMGKVCYLPILRPLKQNKLWFANWIPEEPLGVNKFGILEPKFTAYKLTPPWALDIIIMPLVAFDKKGNRLGMGGGYYDRTLAYLKRHKYWHKPILIGYAYEFQKTKLLSNKAWDVPLDIIVTEKKVYRK